MRRSLLLFLALFAACGMQPTLYSETDKTPAAGPSAKTESLVLGGGCFWCLEAAYELVPGVVSVESGYAGGHVKNPGYKEVCAGTTGHAEVVRIVFDPKAVSITRLLELFWIIHDPTTPNRQGADVGPQYRSIILFDGERQREAARASLAVAQKEWPAPIVTELVALEKFWPAEDYHQDYFRKNPNQGYCRAVVRPKVEKVKKALSAGKP